MAPSIWNRCGETLKSKPSVFNSLRFLKLSHVYNLVLLLPLLSAFLLNINKNVGVFTTSFITVSFMGLTFLLSCNIFYNVALTGETVSFFLQGWTWLDLELLSFSFGGFFDTLSTVMLVVVSCISFCVHTYSLEYMKNDPHLQRFMCYLSLFTFGMFVFVTGNNFIQLFLGWELIGLMSYLLINFWYTRIQANKAAIKAVVVNRIGDTAFAIAIFLIFRTTGSLDFDTVFLLAPQLTNFDVNLICFFLFIAACAKSAQLGLHTWLPDAMEGPTPVSSLIHAATMVTAGIFLIIRCSPLFAEANYILPIMTIIGSLTTFFAATTALVQTDLKRVIAYSTCSQLGYYQKDGGVLYRSLKKRFFSSKPKLTDILPTPFVKKYINLTVSGRYIIKSDFKRKAVIYLWKNKLNGRSYVGRTINLWSRLANYSSNAYLVKHAKKMPICAALLKMGHTSFEFYVLEEISKENIHKLADQENFWFNELKPSYNLAAILDTFIGPNHPRFGHYS